MGEGRNDGFVTSAQTVQSEAKAGTAADVDTASEAAAASMGYWSEDDLPFYYGLARTFPLADRWFSSCLGPTFPNRRFLIAGTAHGLIDDSPYDLLDYPAAGTIFDLLTENGISWVNYHPVASEQSRWRHYARHKGKMARRRVKSARPVSSRSDPGYPEGSAVHGGRLPARDRPVHAACPRPGPVLRRRR